MVRLFHKVSSFGVDDTFSTLTNRRIMLTNRLSVFCILSTCFFIWLYFYIGLPAMIKIELAALALYSLTIVLNALRLSHASRIYFNVLILLHVYVLSQALGSYINIYMFYIPIIMAPFVLFEFSQKKMIAVLCLANVALVATLFARLSLFPPLQISTTETALLNEVIFYVCIICCVLIIYSLLYVNERTTRKLDVDRETLEVQLEAIFDNAVDAHFLMNLGSRKIIKANKRAVEMFEADAENNFYGLHGLDLHKIKPAKEEVEFINNALEKSGTFSGEILYKTLKSKEFWGAISVRLIDIKGQKYHAVRITDISDQKKIKEQTETSLREKELLLAEIHHRVKNNLAIISALINLQIDNLKDNESKVIFEETKDRIYSMALIHNELYLNKSFAQIEFSHYINIFCAYLSKSYQTNVNIQIIEKTEKVFLNIKTAIPCALMLNELITNSFKHAFKNRATGFIEIGLKKEGSEVFFWVADNGPGMDKKLLQSTSMGMSLVTSLAEQIEGQLSYENISGSRFQVKFTP